MAGRLTIVGLGPGRAEWVTLEAAEILRAAAENGEARAYGFPPALAVAREVAPGLIVRDPGELVRPDRPPYVSLVEGLMRIAFNEQREVLYLAPGNALVVNDLVLLLRRACARFQKPLRVVAGLSFVDTVLEAVQWDGTRGLQLHSAWSVAAGRVAVDPAVPALLYELGERVGDGLDGETRSMLAALHDVLSVSYKPPHPLTLIASRADLEYSMVTQSLVLSGLPELEVLPLSNLWIPPRQES